MSNKDSWSFYTPKFLSDFIIHYLKQNTQNGKKTILEPSCWEGVFIQSILESWETKNIKKITLCDVNQEALEHAYQYSWDLKLEKYLWDFLTIKFNNKYDYIIGNPPYIDKKYLSIKQKTLYQKLNNEAVWNNKAINNIWPSFVFKSETLLKKDGILAFVLPEELLTVNYARDTLDFLLKKFNRLEIFSIDKVIFGDAWQNTIVLFAYKKHKEKWLFLGEINVDGNKKTKFTYKSHLLSREDHSTLSQKELSSGLTVNDLFFINKIQKKFNIIWNIASSQTGIVTWANDFFILSHEEIIKNSLKEYGIPIIRKWSYIKNKLYFDKKDFSMLQKEGKPAFFLNFKGNIIDRKAKTYLNIGKKQWINLRYKCNSYKPNRYNIPNVHPAYLFFFKRSHLLPKLIYCPSWIMVTDSAYKINLKNKKYQEFQFCFYNSFTLLMMELWWRKYWGGVLELTPNEFKDLVIPFFEDIPKEKLVQLKDMKINKIEDFISKNDKYLLKERLGLDDDEIKIIQNMRKKLIQRRLKSK